MPDGVSDELMLEYERYLKESKRFNAWRDRAVDQLPSLSKRVFGLRHRTYEGCGFHYDLEKTLGFLIWRLNDFQSYPLDLREMIAHSAIMRVTMNGLFKDLNRAEKEIAARLKAYEDIHKDDFLP